MTASEKVFAKVPSGISDERINIASGPGGVEQNTFEWLETNGLGGWASSTISGSHSRRYHGVLVPAVGGSENAASSRIVLLSRLDETLLLGNQEGATRSDSVMQEYDLAVKSFAGAAASTGCAYLRRFTREHFPVFEFAVEDVVITKTIAAVTGENTTLIVYELLKGNRPVTLRLRPFIAGRDYHSLSHANHFIQRDAYFADGILCLKSYSGVPECFISLPGSKFFPAPDWYYRFDYSAERARGLDAEEDLFTHGYLEKTLQAGERICVITTLHWPAERDGLVLFEQEKARRESISAAAPVPTEVCRVLVRAADQFVIARGEELRTIIAGYHWFTDWGRDTMISLPGICLVTGRFSEAKKILQTFTSYMSEGMIPNRFPDGAEQPEYNTVDATLWLFIAAYKYFQYTKDIPFLRDTLFPKLQESILWHTKGTRYGIRVDGDGLLHAGESGVQLTWMDVKIGDWVVTPRHGKPVEINALWYNANRIMAEFSSVLRDEVKAGAFTRTAVQIKNVFLKAFWNDEEEYLYDVVENGFCDRRFRPNQIFALSLPFSLLSKQQGLKVLSQVEKRLYTPVGLRTLDPADPEYQGVYGGPPHTRDAAYHQGTAWSWLLGPYMTALVRYGEQAGMEKAVGVFEAFSSHLSKAGVGTVSEIFSGNAPHAPEGCIAQAWGVAEPLRAYVEDLCGKVP